MILNINSCGKKDHDKDADVIIQKNNKQNEEAVVKYNSTNKSTGYVGDKAIEVKVRIESRIFVPLGHTVRKDPKLKKSTVDKINILRKNTLFDLEKLIELSDEKLLQETLRKIQVTVGEQIRYFRNSFIENGLDLNFKADKHTVAIKSTEITDDGQLLVSYVADVNALYSLWRLATGYLDKKNIVRDSVAPWQRLWDLDLVANGGNGDERIDAKDPVVQDIWEQVRRERISTQQKFTAEVPIDPSYKKIWKINGVETLCASDFEKIDRPSVMSGTVVRSKKNLFYYFDPKREECPLKKKELLTVGQATVISEYKPVQSYPEYNRLGVKGKNYRGEDKTVIRLAMLFGKLDGKDEGVPNGKDSGDIAYDGLLREIKAKGIHPKGWYVKNIQNKQVIERSPYKAKEAGIIATIFEEPVGKPMYDQPIIRIIVYTPDYISNKVWEKERYKAIMHQNDMVYLFGHAQYGGVKALYDPATYPKDRYQILFFDACWTYQYYTQKILDAYPGGSKNLEIINNSEAGKAKGYFSAWNTFYYKIFQAVGTVKQAMEGNGSTHNNSVVASWNDILRYLDSYAQTRWKKAISKYEYPDTYGVSGALDNEFDPEKN